MVASSLSEQLPLVNSYTARRTSQSVPAARPLSMVVPAPKAAAVARTSTSVPPAASAIRRFSTNAPSYNPPPDMVMTEAAPAPASTLEVPAAARISSRRVQFLPSLRGHNHDHDRDHANHEHDHDHMISDIPAVDLQPRTSVPNPTPNPNTSSPARLANG